LSQVAVPFEATMVFAVSVTGSPNGSAGLAACANAGRSGAAATIPNANAAASQKALR